MFIRLTKKLIAAVLLMFFSSTAMAQTSAQPMSESACSAASSNSSDSAESSCAAFVRGFLQGALLTDAAIVENLSSSSQQSASAKRALETRAGNRNKSLPATYFARFCLPQDLASDDIVRQLAEQMLNQQDTQPQQGQRLYRLIKQLYPCSTFD